MTSHLYKHTQYMNMSYTYTNIAYTQSLQILCAQVFGKTPPEEGFRDV